MTKIRIFAALAVAAAATPAYAAEDSAWAATLERISSGVVSIRVDSTRAFDTEWNSSSQATGFVVDAERGLILTNRHVVTPGPVVAEAVFLKRNPRLTPRAAAAPGRPSLAVASSVSTWTSASRSAAP